jgi:hypothetical protein
VDVIREFGFAADVKLELVPGGAAVKLAAPVAAAAGQALAKLSIIADKAAKVGSFTATIRGTLTFNGKAVTVDAPLQVTIAAAAP